MVALYIGLFVAAIAILVAVSVKSASRDSTSSSRSYRSPEDRGELGERLVANLLGKDEEGKRYILSDFRFYDENKSIQIDHILIDDRGVFVIETKNYSGRVYGNDRQRYWTQVLVPENGTGGYYNGRGRYRKNKSVTKNQFYSPVKQNASHAYHLRRILPKDIPLIPIVVFVQNNTEYIDSSSVIPLNRLEFVMNAYAHNALSSDEIKSIYDKLIAAKSKISDQTHLENIRKEQHDIANNICPRCGGSLVLRSGQYGLFYGCKNYPACKFKKNI